MQIVIEQSVIMLAITTQSVMMQIVIMQSVIMLVVMMQSVMIQIVIIQGVVRQCPYAVCHDGVS